MAPRLQLLRRQGCHLCDDAAAVLTRLAGPAGTVWTQIDVDADPELRAEWGDMVPVLMLGERVVGWGPLSETALRSAVDSSHDS